MVISLWWKSFTVYLSYFFGFLSYYCSGYSLLFLFRHYCQYIWSACKNTFKQRFRDVLSVGCCSSRVLWPTFLKRTALVCLYLYVLVLLLATNLKRHYYTVCTNCYYTRCQVLKPIDTICMCNIITFYWVQLIVSIFFC